MTDNVRKFDAVDFSGVLAELHRLFVIFCGIPGEQTEWVKEYLFGFVYEAQAQTGDDMSYHRRRVRQAEEILRLDPQASMFLYALASLANAVFDKPSCILVAKIEGDEAVIHVACDTEGMSVQKEMADIITIGDGEITVRLKKEEGRK